MLAKLEEIDRTNRRLRLEVSGVVQGVGFRPFVYSTAKALNLKGFVGNESSGVFIEIEGPADAVERFCEQLKNNPPPLAHISSVVSRAIETRSDTDFKITESAEKETDFTLVSPDICICDDCQREFFDPENRRFLYPFINCTNCGPRFTITEKVPYDRPNTTMRDFRMCAECQKEYDDPADRRFHAQPNACGVCGPRTSFIGKDEHSFEGNRALVETRRRLRNGEIVAVKGIGGFHLVCDARNDAALEKLRARKGRVGKPFAVMCRDERSAAKLVEYSAVELDLLRDKARPIVLLPKKDSDLSALIAPGNRFLGVMLPYSPLHFLLFDDQTDVLVVTSGNLSSEPIVRHNIEAFQKLSNLADSFLLHNREIHVSCDDSVMRIFEPPLQIANQKSRVIPIRRSRGFAPFPVELPFEVPPILAVGGELKSTFCLTRENFAFMSQHIGDMENVETLRAFQDSVEQMKNLFHVEPEIVVGDLHPNYLSTNWAQRKFSETARFVKVQHHQAHLAAVMAENGIRDEKVIGFVFDGTGYGTDGKIWGGEVFAGGYERFERVAHLDYFPLAGGDASVKRVYRLALSMLREANLEWSDDLPPVSFCPEIERKILLKQFENNINVVETSSMGRLFDAVAALAGVRQNATYEAQAAIEFESLVDETVGSSYKLEIRHGERLTFGFDELIRELVSDVRAKVDVSIVSAKFHNAVAEAIAGLSVLLRTETNINKIALSGGCFQNVALLRKSLKLLATNDFEVLIHQKVPPNDGGLALGQAVLGAVSSGNAKCEAQNAESEDLSLKT